MSASLTFPRHYDTAQIKTMDDLRQCFPNGADSVDEMNWLFTGTSGVLGTYTGAFNAFEDVGDDDTDHVTVLVVRPRTVVMLYGQLECTREDVEWLKSLEIATQRVIAAQFGPDES